MGWAASQHELEELSSLQYFNRYLMLAKSGRISRNETASPFLPLILLQNMNLTCVKPNVTLPA